MADNPVLDVLLTVDVELWPTTCGAEPGGVRAALDRNIYGRTSSGDYGLPHQLQMLNAHGLKAVFLVEALCADAIGMDCLGEIVDLITAAGHEVQLHLHTEWLKVIDNAPISGRTGRNMRDFTEDEQTAIIARGLDNLRACGVEQVEAFRAGNYGADFNTLRALARNGIHVDTSYNRSYLSTDCGLESEIPVSQPTEIEGVLEYPVACFDDRPGHGRHVQLGSCSYAQLSTLMQQAWQRNWSAFVIVSHSFELMNQRRDRADPIMLRRFDRWCRYLADHTDRFRTIGFGDLDARPGARRETGESLKSSLATTAWRHVEQIARRVYG